MTEFIPLFYILIIFTISGLCIGLIYRQLIETKQLLTKERNKAVSLQASLSETAANHRHLEEKLNTQKIEFEALHKKFALEFENLANKIFEEKSTKFTQQNKDAMDTVLKPLNEKLGEFKKKVEDTYNQESKERASLKGEIKQLFELNQTMAKEAQNLTNALKGSAKTQGNWGELILETILEKSGLAKGREFVTQESYHTEEGKRQYPDVILFLPQERHMIIDSKVSLTAYERYYATDDDAEKKQALKDHVTSIRTHIKELSQKNYQNLYAINSMDFVLMFLPIEPAFGLAVQHDTGLFYDALDKNIVMVSPSTLLATLQIISNIWKQDRQNKNAIEIAQKGGALYDKFVMFLEDLMKIGSQLNSTKDTYDKAINKLSTGKGNLINRAETIKILGAKTTKTIPDQLTNDILPAAELQSVQMIPHI